LSEKLAHFIHREEAGFAVARGGEGHDEAAQGMADTARSARYAAAVRPDRNVPASIPALVRLVISTERKKLTTLIFICLKQCCGSGSGAFLPPGSGLFLY
jgi:hypothetical protein